MTAAGAAAEMMDFRRGCGSSDGPTSQGSSERPPLNAKAFILLDSRSRAAVAIVFSGPDLALEPANRVRHSHCSAPPDNGVPRPRPSFVKTLVRDDRSPRL